LYRVEIEFLQAGFNFAAVADDDPDIFCRRDDTLGNRIDSRNL
jgi:hypothetical protein